METNLDLHFSSSLILRTPAYSYERYQNGELPLDDPYFREAIQIASPAFYEQLEKKNFDIGKINPRERLTLVKYFNRMCFRPTPFGLFSSVTSLKWNDTAKSVVLAKKLKAHTLLSFEQTLHITDQVRGDFPEEIELIGINTSIYTVGDEYRHLKLHNEEKKGDRKYLINAIEKTPEISQVLCFLHKPKSKKELITFVMQKFEASEEQSREYVAQLLAEQIILSNLEPNITGTDHLKRIAGMLSKIGQKNELHTNETQSNFKPSEKSPFYVISERPAVQNTVPAALQQQIRDGISCALRLNALEKSPGLDSYSKAFAKKYDQQWVPLMEALDPETGIAYQSLGANHQQPVLLDGLDINSPVKKSRSMDWTASHKLLLDKLITLTNTSPVIQLSYTDLKTLPEPDKKPQLPPSFPVMFRMASDQLYLEQAGGATGTGLFGRFTPVNNEIKNSIKEITERERSLNPDVIFAEVIHIAEQHAANIDRREILYPYEIPVMCTSSLPAHKQIALSDLWISNLDGEIILWSERLKKRIIPRLSSAYNHQRSNLAAFRFLCDLQYQGIQSQLSFDLSHLFPDLDRYPRVQYQDTILSLQTWKLSEERIKDIIGRHEEEQTQALTALIQQLQLPKMISLNEHDHQLILNLDEPADQQTFLQILQSSKELSIKEFPFTEGDSLVKDQHKQPYSNQFMAALYNQQAVYQTKLEHLPTGQNKVQRKFVPGSEWLYLKIYCHPYRSNALLTEQLLLVINQFNQQIKQYFFIRYSDPAYHIRLRLQIYPNHYTQILGQFKKQLQPLLDSALISDYSVNTYERELERYNPEIIEQTERFFCAGSRLVMDHLLNNSGHENELTYFQIAFSSLALITETFEIPLEKKERLCRFHYNALAKEFGLNDKTTEQLKHKYRKIKEAGLFRECRIDHYLNDEPYERSYPAFQSALTELNRAIAHWRLSKKIRLLSSLIHMHLNRIFTEMPREQEMVTYFCMSNYYYSKLQQEKKNTAVLIPA